MSCRPVQPCASGTATASCSSVRPASASKGAHASRSSSRNSSESRYISLVASDRDRLAVLAEDLTQDGTLLAERRVGGSAADEVRHEVGLARSRSGGRLAQPPQRRLDLAR